MNTKLKGGDDAGKTSFGGREGEREGREGTEKYERDDHSPETRDTADEKDGRSLGDEIERHERRMSEGREREQKTRR